MNTLTLNLIKQHLNIDQDFTADDEYLTSLGEVAEEMVLKHLDYNNINEIVVKFNGFPVPIRHAMLLLVGNFYMNRESVSTVTMTSIPHSYEYLLAVYKNRENYQG